MKRTEWHSEKSSVSAIPTAAAALLTILLALNTPFSLGAVDSPREPVVPDVQKKEKKGGEVKTSPRRKLQALVVMTGGNRFSGLLDFSKETITIPARVSVTGRREVVRYSDIKTIRIMTWKKSKKRGKAWLFLPHVLKIETRDGMVVKGRISGLPSRIRCHRGKTSFSLYTHYYDYRKGKKWEYSGESASATKVSQAHPRTIREIRFTAQSPVPSQPAGELLEMFLKRK